jgi:hypothetical protein
MDYDSVITPGAKCINCDHHKQVINTSIGPLVLCGLYGQVNENVQAEHCINYYEVKNEKTD